MPMAFMQPEDDGHRPQQLVTPQPAHALGQLALPRLRCSAASVRGGAELAGDQEHQAGGHGERRRRRRRTAGRRPPRAGGCPPRARRRCWPPSRRSTCARWPAPAASASTRAGMSVWPQLSRSTSAMPSSSVATSSTTYRPGRVPVTESSVVGPGQAAAGAEHDERDHQREHGPQRVARRPSPCVGRPGR